MRNRILSKAVPALEFCPFCNSQKCVPLVRQFWGLIPTVSCSFSSEKSYSPSRLMCCQETAEPLAAASKNASRVAASSVSSTFCAKSTQVQQRLSFLLIPLHASPH